MIKKLSLLLAAVAVVASAIPAMASAHAVTDSANHLAPKGSIVTAIVSDLSVTPSLLGPLTCKSLTLTHVHARRKYVCSQQRGWHHQHRWLRIGDPRWFMV
jgi:hypothetical protein